MLAKCQEARDTYTTAPRHRAGMSWQVWPSATDHEGLVDARHELPGGRKFVDSCGGPADAIVVLTEL